MGLYSKLTDNADSDMYPMHMPGHKRNPEWMMLNPYSIDITEIDGFDNLHSPTGLIADIERKAAQLYRVQRTYLLVNGSTSGILTGISAVCNNPAIAEQNIQKSRILISRGSHLSVYHAAALCRLQVETLFPDTDEYGMLKGLTASRVEEVFNKYNDIAMVVLTSPTYEGVFSEVKEIADVVHKYNAILMVDEAHGAHLRFMQNEDKPMYKSAIDCDADIVIQSIHKTLPAFTQTALLHLCSDRVNCEKIRYYLDVYQTSSPSYILMAGIEKCIDFLTDDSHKVFGKYIDRLKAFYCDTRELKHLKVINADNRDMGKLLIATDKSKIYSKDKNQGPTVYKEFNSRYLYDRLINKYHIQPEMVTCNYVLCMTSVMDTDEGFERLKNALLELDRLQEEALYTAQQSLSPADSFTRVELNPHNEKLYEIYEVEGMSTERVSIFDAVNRVSADYIFTYPPGIAMIVPGERIDNKVLDIIKYINEQGVEINKKEILVLK